jgi:hypothetical protein
MPINLFKGFTAKEGGYTPPEEALVKRADQLEGKLLSIVNEEENSFVKFNAIVYLLNDFFVAEILKSEMDLRGVHRSLEEATKQTLEWVKNQTSGIKYVQGSVLKKSRN